MLSEDKQAKAECVLTISWI